MKATTNDLEALKKMFIKLDVSKDGNLQKDELKKGMSEMTGILIGDEQSYDEIIEGLDLDGNGVIDYTEFITGAIDK